MGKDYGTTGTRSVTVALLGSSALPLDKGGRPSTVAPSHCFTYRKIRLPQANARIRRRIVQEELSFGLPFPLHECVWDFYLQAGSEAFAVVAQQARWQQLSSRWGLVQSVDPEPLCYLRAALQAGVGDALVIDFGASHTTWVALNSGKLEWVRTMMRGGQLLTQQIADESRIPLHEAEELKRRRGTEIPTVQAFLQDLLDEVLLAKPLPFRKVLLCGGGSGMPGLRAYLHSQFGVEPSHYPPFSVTKNTFPPTEQPFRVSLANNGFTSVPKLRPQVAGARSTPGYPCWAYRWDFGDGSSYSAPYLMPEAGHAYPACGVYTVRAEVTDTLGNVAIGSASFAIQRNCGSQPARQHLVYLPVISRK